MKLPEHIAIIMDGNGRWAKAKGFPRSYGHVVGCDNLEKMCDVIFDMGIKYLTVYAFSTENWKRSINEVGILMNLFRRYLKRLLNRAKKDSIRIRVIGSRVGLAPDILKIINELEEKTKNYTNMYFQIARNYGSRDEIMRGVKKIAEDIRLQKISPEDITEDMISKSLDTGDIPDPDLLIRTSGEQRISNFLLWQLAYSEMYFTDTAWPDFKKPQLMEAIEAFNGRDRRYGAVK
jgi:undecaprenyl diphosphate synthase